MQHVLFALPTDPEAFLQAVLMTAARFTPPHRHGGGFHHDVGDTLKGGLAFLDRHLPAEEVYLMRLYASFQGEKAFGCLMTDAAEELFTWIQRHWAIQENSTGPLVRSPGSWKNRSWGLVGLAYSGGVVLFDESREEPYRQDIEEDMAAAYLPMGEEADHAFAPEVSTEACLLALAKALLDFLPEQEGDEESQSQ